MKKRLIAVLAAVFAATVLGSGAVSATQAREGLDWEKRPSTHHFLAERSRLGVRTGHVLQPWLRLGVVAPPHVALGSLSGSTRMSLG